MGQSTISARIDSKDKSDFDKFCNNVGLSASTAINLFVKAVLRENRIPFDIVHGVSNFIIMMLLYRPMARIMQSVNSK